MKHLKFKYGKESNVLSLIVGGAEGWGLKLIRGDTVL